MKPIEIAECIEVLQGLLDKDFFSEDEKTRIKSLVMSLIEKMEKTEELAEFIKDPVKSNTAKSISSRSRKTTPKKS